MRQMADLGVKYVILVVLPWIALDMASNLSIKMVRFKNHYSAFFAKRHATIKRCALKPRGKQGFKPSSGKN